jgi:hypothetical protein
MPCARLLELAIGESGNVSGCSRWLRLADAKRPVAGLHASGQREAFAKVRLAVQKCAACTSVVEPGLGYSTVADTGDRFFLTLPFLRLSLVSTHPRNPLCALASSLKAYSSLLPSACLWHLHFVHFAAPACGCRVMS